MRKQKVTIQNKEQRRQSYSCPNCGSNVVLQKNRDCNATYSCGSEPSCKGCVDWVSDSQTNMRLVCSNCGFSWTIMSKL